MGELEDIATFIRVIDLGSFTKAAEAIGVPKSTVSRAVTRLEADLGAQLLRRTTRRINLTETGESLYHRAAPLVADLQEATRLAREEGTAPRGLLRITAPVDFGIEFLQPHIVDFLERYPDVQIDMELTGTYVDLVQHGVDIAFRAGPLRDSTLIARKLPSGSPVLYASPDYLARRGQPLTPSDLEHHDCILFGPQRMHGTWTLSGPGATATVRPLSRLSSNDFGFIKRAVIAGAGIAPVPHFLLATEAAEGRVQRVLPEFALPSGALHLVYPATRHLSVKLRTFIDFIMDRINRSLDSGNHGEEADAAGSDADTMT